MSRHYHNGEELYGIHGHGQNSSVISTEKPFSHSYGLDFQQVIDSSKAAAAETEKESLD